MARFTQGGGSGDGSALNYVQLAGQQVIISSAPNAIIDIDITTTGKPVQISVTGDGTNASAGSWVKMNLFRDNVAIGNEIQLEASAVSENVPYAINFIDNVPAGTYNYSARITDKAIGDWTFGELSGPVMNAVELTGFKGDAGDPGTGSNANIADFIFTDNGSNSSITLPGDKGMRIEAGADSDLYITAGDDLYIQTLGQGDDIFIQAADDVRFSAGNENFPDGTIQNWTMNSEGELHLPGGGYIANPTNSSGDGYGNDTLKLVPDGDLTFEGGDQYIVIDPTAPNHIHVRAGGVQDASFADLFLGAERTNVRVSDSAGNVQVTSKRGDLINSYVNLNIDSSNFFMTTMDSVTEPNAVVNVDGLDYAVVNVQYNVPNDGYKMVEITGGTFTAGQNYTFRVADGENGWTFDSNGYLIGPAEGLISTLGLYGPEEGPLNLFALDEIVLDGDGGEFLNDSTDPRNQIATIGYVQDSIPDTFDKIYTTHNADGTNIKIGDDAWIGDIDHANTVNVNGYQNSGTGYVSMGDAGQVYIGNDGSNNLVLNSTVGNMNFYMDGGMYIGAASSDNQIIKRSDLSSIHSVPTGGTTGQVLSKVDETDYNVEWTTAAGSSSTSVIKHTVKLGVAANKGQAVYVSSADGTNMIVSKASNATEGTSSKTMGLVETTGVLNDTVNVIAEGLLAGLDTSIAAAGDPVWLGTDGNLVYGLANKPVAPDHLVFIGIVTRANQNNGEIFVKVQNGFELNELHTVLLEADASIADNEVLAFDSATGLWKNQTATEAGLQTRVANVSDTEIGYLAGVTSAIQTQLDAKLSTATAGTTYAPKASPTFTGTVTVPSVINGTSASTNMFLFPTTSAANVTIADAITNGTLGFATNSAFNGTINIATGATTSGSKTINIGTGQAVTGATYMTLGSTNGTSNINLLGVVYSNGLSAISNTAAVNLFNNTTSGNVTIGNALTSSSVALANGTNFSGSINIASGGTVSGIKTINIGANGQAGSTTSIVIGSGTGATSNTYLNGKVIVQNPTVPASATATGTAGQIAWDANYIYVCTATNTWKRTALSSW